MTTDRLPDLHVPDLLAPNLKLVFCGTALGRKSAEVRAYYANPTNKFWRTLHETGITLERIAPANYTTLLSFGIGLTDLCKTHAGQDAELTKTHFDRTALEEKICHYQPELLAFTSKKAGSIFLNRKIMNYGIQEERTGETRIIILPSPSGAGARYWDIAPWHDLARLYRKPNV